MRPSASAWIIAAILATAASAPIVAEASPVPVQIDISYGPRPDATPRRLVTTVQFENLAKANAVCGSQANVDRLVRSLQKKNANLGTQAIFGAHCVPGESAAIKGFSVPPPPSVLSPKVLAAMRENNTVQRVTLELHFLTADGRSKVITDQAQGFRVGDAAKFCAADLTAASKGIAEELAATNRAFATMKYVGANCAIDKSGSIRVSTQMYPIEDN